MNETANPRTSLAVLDNAPAPEFLKDELAQLASLPESAIAELWTVLEIALPEPLSPSVNEAVDAFCAAHSVPQPVVARSLRTLRFLLRAAARTNTPKATLLADVRAVAGAGVDVAETIVGRYYAPAMAKLESEIATRTLAGHGKLLTDFEWRLETITASSQGRGLKVPLVTLTFRYDEGGQHHALTLQTVPSVARKLRDALSSFLG